MKELGKIPTAPPSHDHDHDHDHDPRAAPPTSSKLGFADVSSPPGTVQFNFSLADSKAPVILISVLLATLVLAI